MTSLTAGPPSRRVDFGTVLIQQFNLTKQHLISGCINTHSPVNSVNIVLVFSLTIQKYWFWCKLPMWRMPQKHQTDYFCLCDRQVYLFLLKAQIPKPWCTSLLPHGPLFTLLKITSTKKRKNKTKQRTGTHTAPQSYWEGWIWKELPQEIHQWLEDAAHRPTSAGQTKDYSSNPFKWGGANCAPTPAPFIYGTLRTPYFTHLTTKQALATAL